MLDARAVGENHRDRTARGARCGFSRDRQRGAGGQLLPELKRLSVDRPFPAHAEDEANRPWLGAHAACERQRDENGGQA